MPIPPSQSSGLSNSPAASNWSEAARQEDSVLVLLKFAVLHAHLQKIKELEGLDFSGKGEAFVESKFLSPLLECLGYEKHRDYEVIRHGDDGSAFKLTYPPVADGAKKVRHYHPDYIPTIRKQTFWIVEAKSPTDVFYPFEAKYLVQGFQYCVHPEIQAKYLVVTTGLNTAVYDAHGSCVSRPGYVRADFGLSIVRAKSAVGGNIRAALGREIEDPNRDRS
jgi:hypothetical protein